MDDAEPLNREASLTAIEWAELNTHEEVIERDLGAFVRVGNALRAIRDGRLYRATHATFELYLQERWGMARRSGYRYIEAAEVIENVSHGTHCLPANERQARELAALAPEEQHEAWAEVVALADGAGITAEQVRRIVERRAQVTGARNLSPG